MHRSTQNGPFGDNNSLVLGPRGRLVTIMRISRLPNGKAPPGRAWGLWTPSSPYRGEGSFWKGLRLLVNQSMSWLTWSNWGGRLDLGCRIDVNVAEASESVLRGDVLKYIVLCLKKMEKEAWYLTSSARARLPATQMQCKYPSMFTNARQNTLTHAPCTMPPETPRNDKCC